MFSHCFVLYKYTKHNDVASVYYNTHQVSVLYDNDFGVYLSDPHISIPLRNLDMNNKTSR